MPYESLTLDLQDHIATITLNRPEKGNALNAAMWTEIRQAFEWVDRQSEARVAILRGEGKHFCTGIDLHMMMNVVRQIQTDCDGRTREELRNIIVDMQGTVGSLERCRKPVLAAIHGACIGGGIDLVCCADMRYATADAQFSIREIDIGMTADVGTLQRMPKLVGEGMVRELAYTGRVFSGAEAADMRFVNRTFFTPQALFEGVLEIARTIAQKGPLAMRGTKEMITYARDHSVADGLNYVAAWNAAMLMSADLAEAMQAGVQKRKPVFKD